MSGRIERGISDDGRGDRRYIRRREDAEFVDWRQRLEERMTTAERVLARHASLFQDFGAEEMSLQDREALPGMIEVHRQAERITSTRRTRERRWIAVAGLTFAAWQAIAPFVTSWLAHATSAAH